VLCILNCCKKYREYVMTFQNYGLKILYSQTRPKRLLVLETKKVCCSN
jgi:hypothetical protein